MRFANHNSYTHHQAGNPKDLSVVIVALEFKRGNTDDRFWKHIYPPLKLELYVLDRSTVAVEQGAERGRPFLLWLFYAPAFPTASEPSGPCRVR